MFIRKKGIKNIYKNIYNWSRVAHKCLYQESEACL